MTRTAPDRSIEKWRVWRRWSSRWNWIYIITGGGSSALATLVAANTKAGFFGEPWNWIIASIAAFLSFLVTGLAAQAKSSSFETAARELEKAITSFETDPTVTEVDLGVAEKRGIDILNRLKPH